MMRKRWFFTPESYEEYENLPEEIKTRLREYTLVEAVKRIAQSVEDNPDENSPDNALEGITDFLKHIDGNSARNAFLFSGGVLEKSIPERFIDWMYWQYIRLFTRVIRRTV